MTAMTVLADQTEAIKAAASAIADELTASSLDVRNPEWDGSQFLKVTNVPGIVCEVLVGADGSVEWEWRPLDSRKADPAWTAEAVLRILGADATAHPPAAPAGQFSFKSVVGRMLADCGMRVCVNVQVDQRFFEVYSEILVTNPERPGRGSACVGDDGSVFWQCRISEQPGDAGALDPGEIARMVARALTEKGHVGSASCDPKASTRGAGL